MKRLKSILFVASAAIVMGVVALPVQQADAVSAGSSAALSIPPKKNYIVEQGKSVDDKLTIRNMDTKFPLTLNLRVIDFTFTDDGGSPKLFTDPNAPQTTWSLKPFLSVPKTVTIEPSSSKSLDLKVSIPAGHGAGSYYSAIFYSTGAPGEGGNVGLSASGVTLAFVTIPGKVNEDLKLEKFGAYQKATSTKKAGYLGITMDMPQNMAYTVKNNGNVTEAPAGTITLKSMFGQEYTIDNLNPNGSLALIGQSRTFTSCIKLKDQEVNINSTTAKTQVCDMPGLWPGYYSAKISAFYGQNGNLTKEITGVGSFWYLPWWFIALCVALLLVLAYVIWRIVRAIRRKTGKTKKSSKK